MNEGPSAIITRVQQQLYPHGVLAKIIKHLMININNKVNHTEVTIISHTSPLTSTSLASDRLLTSASIAAARLMNVSSPRLLLVLPPRLLSLQLDLSLSMDKASGLVFAEMMVDSWCS